MSELGSAAEGAPRNLTDETLSITQDQVHEYIKAKKIVGACEACGAIEWELSVHGNEPAIFAVSSVRNSALGAWFFHLLCVNCGNMRALNAGHLWHHFYGRDQQNG